MNTRGRSDIESNEEIPFVQSEFRPSHLGIPEYSQGHPEPDIRQSMYKAAIKGDWAPAEKILSRDPSLAFEKLTKTGDIALHVAVCSKNTKFVQEIVNRVNPIELELQDGRGYSACCYAAKIDEVDAAEIMMKKNANLGKTRNKYDTTPLQLAVFYGKKKSAMSFLRLAQVDDLSQEEWVELLLVSIRSKMYGVALKILENDGSLAVKKGADQQITALHVLAKLDLSGWKIKAQREMEHDIRNFAEKLWAKIQKLVKKRVDQETALHVQSQLDLSSSEQAKFESRDLRNLAEKLWTEIQKLGKDKVLELISNPPILHEAAKVGNVELITMITRAYPDLLKLTNDEGHSIYHIAAMYQQEFMLEHIKEQPEDIRGYNGILEDVNGNNLLHLAGKLQYLTGLQVIAERDVRMRRAFEWFNKVKSSLPPYFQNMRNRDGYTPIEFFWMEHRELLANSEAYMKKTAESCMLISTIILTLVFAAAFAPPGGFNQDTGIPILLKRNWFACFIIFEVLALFTSTYSILGFWSIISSNYRVEQFFILPHHLRHAMCALLLSVFCAISAFLSAFFLVFIGEKKTLVVSFMLPLYALLVVGISYQLFKLLRRNNRLQYYSHMGAISSRNNLDNDSLWRRAYNFGASTLYSFGSCF